jgi:Nucleotidyl transferase AbiEii toxin, Type IV TA system
VHDEVLDPEKRRVIALQGAMVHEQSFFLAGGTGLGLRLGHRLSRDIDWFWLTDPLDAVLAPERYLEFALAYYVTFGEGREGQRL